MAVYIVQGLNDCGEPEIEVAVSADNPEQAEAAAKQQESFALMLEDGVVTETETWVSEGPIHLLSFPMQGV